jgi:5-(carboxyamino)imidazole ribonucleotide synthase
MTNPSLPLGATIGILGGGQLGRMLSVAASRLGYQCHIYEPATTCPAAQVAAHHTATAYDDHTALAAFAQAVDAITYEFENIPASALDVLAAHAPIHPGRKALEVSQDRLTEKTFLQNLGLRTAPFADITCENDLRTALAEFGGAGILKTRRFGYDGKGQQRLDTDTDTAAAMTALANTPAILEGLVDFAFEVSVIAARGQDGAVACYDPGVNVHKGGILHTTRVPAPLRPAQRSDAILLAAQILNALEYVGVMGVELFVTPSGLVVNEIAPRVHNSGHWTQNGCLIDQFEQHIRAVAGLPLGDAMRHSDVEMTNLIGADINALPALSRENAALHLYGKAEARAGRKMGHINRIIQA